MNSVLELERIEAAIRELDEAVDHVTLARDQLSDRSTRQKLATLDHQLRRVRRQLDQDAHQGHLLTLTESQQRAPWRRPGL